MEKEFWLEGIEKIAKGMVAAAEKSGEKVAEGIRDGFGATAKEIGKSLGGTRAELMMDCLLIKATANGGKIPEPDGEEWNTCKKIATKVMEEIR